MWQNPSHRRDFESQRLLLERELYRLYGIDNDDLKWVRETLMRLETRRRESGTSEQDRADLDKARAILDRARAIAVFANPNQARDDRGRWTSGGALPKAIAYLKEHAANDYSGSGKRCAELVRKALAKEGIDLSADLPRSGSAKDFGEALRKHGFDVVADVDRGLDFPPPPSQKYKPEAGDVVVIQAIARHPDGHMAM